VGAGVASRPVPAPYRGCDWLLSVGEPTFGLRFSPLLSGVGPLTIPCGWDHWTAVSVGDRVLSLVSVPLPVTWRCIAWACAAWAAAWDSAIATDWAEAAFCSVSAVTVVPWLVGGVHGQTSDAEPHVPCRRGWWYPGARGAVPGCVPPTPKVPEARANRVPPGSMAHPDATDERARLLGLRRGHWRGPHGLAG